MGNCSYRPIACHLPATCAVINEALNCFGILEFELLLQYSISMGHDNPPQSSCECESENKQKITSICRLAVRTRVSTHCHSLRSARVVASSFRMQDDCKMDPYTANLCIVLPKRCKESHRWPRMRRRKEKEKKKLKKY